MYFPVYTIRRMPIYDVTVPISNELPTWPGDPAVQMSDWRSLSNGDGANVSLLNFGQANHETHDALLSHGVIILEGLNLTGVPAGKYELICLPLRLRSNIGDGAPARVVLRTLG